MFWKLIPLLPIMTFSSSAIGIANGDFDGAGFPDSVLPLHLWVNAFEGAGWALVLVLSFIGRSALASKIAVFLAGMWCWDMITTMNLSMPVPPLQIVWGPISVIVMLLLAYQLRLEGQKIVKVL